MKTPTKLLSFLLALTLVLSGIPGGIGRVEAAGSVKTTSITSVSKTAGATVTIKWKKVGSAAGYLIYRKTGNNGKYNKIATVKGKSKTSYIDKKTANGKTYYYSVQPYNGSTYSKMSGAKRISTGKAPAIGNFNSSAASLVAGNNSVIFTVNMTNPMRVKNKSVMLIKGKSKVGYFHDDGKNGDVKAYDGIFSYKASVKGSVGSVLTFKVKYGKKTSSAIKLTIFSKPNESDLNTVKTADTEFTSLGSASAVYSRATEMKKNGEIISVSQSGKTVTIQFRSGIWYVYTEPISNVSGNGSQLSVLSAQPFYSDNENPVMHNSSTSETLAKSLYDKYGVAFSANYRDNAVTRSFVKNMKSDGVYLWNGHGAYSDELGSVIFLGEMADTSDMGDLVYGTLSVSNGDRYAITSGFIDMYMGKLDNTFLYLGTCAGAKNDRLCGTLKAHGVTTLAFSEEVYTEYVEKMMNSMVSSMLTVDENTQYYMTVSDALAAAKLTNGSTDGYKGAALKLYGNGNYRFSDECFATISISSTSEEIKSGSTVNLSVESNVAGNKLIWSSSNPAVASVSASGNTATVKGKKGGSAVISCKAGDKTVKCAVTVKGESVTTLPDGKYYSERTSRKDSYSDNIVEGSFFSNKYTYPGYISGKIKDNNLVVKGRLGRYEYVNGKSTLKKKYAKKTYTIPINSDCKYVIYPEGEGDHTSYTQSEFSKLINTHYMLKNANNTEECLMVFTIENGSITEISLS